MAIVPAAYAATALGTLQGLPAGSEARVIGEVTESESGRVILRTRIGSHRRLERLSGEQLPRIC